MTNEEDLKFIKRYGCHNISPDRSRPIGVCLFCGSDITRCGTPFVKSFDGLFCSMDCCHGYYEIYTEDQY